MGELTHTSNGQISCFPTEFDSVADDSAINRGWQTLGPRPKGASHATSCSGDLVGTGVILGRRVDQRWKRRRGP